VTLGERWARALGDKDYVRVRELLHPAVDFCGVTPGRAWEAVGPDAVEEVLRVWFDDTDVIEALAGLETGGYADRERVGYRYRVRNPAGLHLVEQQAYYAVEGGRIAWMRVVCGGYRPIDETS
jgi:hypothetical protein